MKRLVLALTLLLCLATIASAQKRSDIFENYDLDSTTEIFCNTATFSTTPPEGMTACSTGSAAEDGWIDTRTEDFKGIAVHIDALALTAGSIDVRVYGRVKTGTTPIPLSLIIAYTTVTRQYIVVPEAVFQVRVGLRINGTDDGDASPEDISIYHYGSRRLR